MGTQQRFEIVSFSFDQVDDSAQAMPFLFAEQKVLQHILDVRLAPNPFYIDQLRELTGLDVAVKKFVLKHLTSETWVWMQSEIERFMRQVVLEGHSAPPVVLRFCFGCTGGRHRSVASAEHYYRALQSYLGAKCGQISIRHLQLERLGIVKPPPGSQAGIISPVQ
ncbi:hypothetical protein ACFL0L_01105 [Patescibacteria group bacterium]